MSNYPQGFVEMAPSRVPVHDPCWKILGFFPHCGKPLIRVAKEAESAYSATAKGLCKEEEKSFPEEWDRVQQNGTFAGIELLP
ncbi:hypothetical protein HYALB_00011551 [Hymenoscyphus albidus]|uniref:Uncharacterized protein n=1 Tax=Hymenoscyphus albidus TaxID=595503 RepID=A0A9N9LR19_9HELO|nr:hypothetical protein HYALB_00011551 [Hymenoscyphus albidus]